MYDLRKLQDLRKIQVPWRDNQPDEGMRIQDFYATAVERATAVMHTVSTIALVVAIVAALFGVGAIAAAVMLFMYYRKHHRIPATLVSYDSYGDWAIVRLPDGVEIKAHCPIQSLPEGAEIVVAIHRDGAFVIDPAIRRGKPSEPPMLVSVEDV